MLISPILSSPTIDKIHLKSFDFKVKTSNILRGNISLDEQGRTEREKYYFKLTFKSTYNFINILEILNCPRNGLNLLNYFRAN